MKFNRKQNKNFSVSWWIIVLALVAGLIGGVVGSLGVQKYSNEISTSVGGTKKTVKVSDTKVKGTSAATKAFQQTAPAVVSVINLQQQQSSGWSLFDTAGQDDDLKTASEGSGVIYKTSGREAFIVTNNHVVTGSKALQVLLSDGTKLNATLVGTDKISDIAVLKVKSSKIKQVAEFANSNEVQTGESVLAIGSPLGSDYATSVTEGIVSATKREVESEDDDGNSLGKATVIQTDAAINPGNSGGALINLSGQVIGINSMKLTNSSGGTSVEGMGFSIPSNTVVNIINQLEKDGKVVRPALGIKMVDLSRVSIDDQKNVLELSDDHRGGVIIVNVTDGTPADRAGLKKYDVITKADGQDLDDTGDLRGILNSHKVGDTINITYYRKGHENTTEIKLTAKANDNG
ncbi:peptidase S1 and S6 chymotrypsin/Hap [Weissella koreensis KACC 15510]|uniref:S1C family serine protease n=1 Tax=Weissella koreensis TaxID=165096 RepID=UPI0002175044|nr:trypsin-like peptidase domain-containing protein [Weissella koreensis]AEJ23370.1 peptidase S1 and S6 chymotrypsin/Hap [Weissella koreensis KACC 15510]